MASSLFLKLVLGLSFCFVTPSYQALTGRALAPSHHAQRRATTCNGHAELCGQSFGNVTFVGAHDSYAIGVNSFAVNQDQDITRQLDDGIRMLQMQAHFQGGVIHLCHTLCSLFDGGTLADFLTKVKSWMDANPNEVLSLLIVNSDNRPPSEYDAVFKQAGLDTISFVPQTNPLPLSQWPTLGSMIDSNKRLVTFLDNQADPSAVPYLLDEFSNMWETAFNVIDPNFDCVVNRTHGDPSTQLSLINHFLDRLVLNQPAPDIDKANVTNSASGLGSLSSHIQTCVTDHGRPPNFLLVDFYEYGGGSVFQIASDINGVQYSPSTPVATPMPTTSGSASGNSTGGSNSGNGSNGASSLRPIVSSNGQSVMLVFIMIITGVMLGTIQGI